MQRLAQVPHQAEARNRCSGFGLGKPDRGEKPTLQPKGLVHTQREQPLAQAERVQVHENPAEKQRPQAGKPPSEAKSREDPCNGPVHPGPDPSHVTLLRRSHRHPGPGGHRSRPPLPLSERHPGGDPARPPPTTRSADINIMTWNVNKLAYTRELFLRQLLTSHKVNLMVLTEVELPRVEATAFSLVGYNVHLPPEVDPVRVLVLVRDTHKIKARPDLSAPGLQMIWLELEAKMGKILIGGLYRQWHMGNASIEQSEFAAALDLVNLASAEARRVLVLGDINLDQHKSSDDTSYYRRALLSDLRTRMEEASLDYHPTPATHASYGLHDDGHSVQRHRMSCLDHVYSTGLHAEVTAIPDFTTDHRPILASIRGLGLP
jgi:hypothetical protein